MSTDGLEMVRLLCGFEGGLVRLLANLFWSVGTGLLEQYDGLGRSLD